MHIHCPTLAYLWFHNYLAASRCALHAIKTLLLKSNCNIFSYESIETAAVKLISILVIFITYYRYFADFGWYRLVILAFLDEIYTCLEITCLFETCQKNNASFLTRGLIIYNRYFALRIWKKLWISIKILSPKILDFYKNFLRSPVFWQKIS